jgi:hypothetical protein
VGVPPNPILPNHFHVIVALELHKVPGFVGAHLSQRNYNDKIEFLVLTIWQSMDAMRASPYPAKACS